MAALVLSRCCPGSTTLSSLLHGLSDCLPRYFLHLGYDWSLCLAPSLPPYGVTSMSFRPGCHRPFHRSYCLRSLPLQSQDCVLSSFGSVSFASAIPDIVLQHFITSTVVTLRPFALSLYSWRILFCGRSGIRTRDVLRFLHRLSEALIHFQRLIPNVAFNHSAILPSYLYAVISLRPYLPQSPLPDEPINLVLRICPGP